MRAAIILTGATVLVAAMLGRIGWVDWTTIDGTLWLVALVVPPFFILMTGAGLVFGLPILLVVGVVKLAARLLRTLASRRCSSPTSAC